MRSVVFELVFKNFVYVLPDDSTDLPKHVEAVKQYRVCLLGVHCFGFVNEYFKQNDEINNFKLLKSVQVLFTN
jgi:hypothetical protein